MMAMKAKTQALKARKVLKNFKLKPDVAKRLKAHSEKTGMTMTKIVERAVDQFCAIKA